MSDHTSTHRRLLALLTLCETVLLIAIAAPPVPERRAPALVFAAAALILTFARMVTL